MGSCQGKQGNKKNEKNKKENVEKKPNEPQTNQGTELSNQQKNPEKKEKNEKCNQFNVLQSFKQNFGKFYKDYTVSSGQTLGRGNNFQVLQVQNNKTNQHRAVKVYKKKSKNNDFFEQISTQISILKQLVFEDHPNIIKIYEYYEDGQNYYLVQELCSQENVLDMIIQKKKLTEEIICETMKQILLAINYLHQQEIIHANLMPDKMLIVNNDGQSMIKLVGFANALSQKAKVKKGKVNEKNYFYVSPEIVKNQLVTKETDIWSCGIILYFLLTGYLPFKSKNQNQTLFNICKGTVQFDGNEWNNVSKSAKKLVQQMLQYDPKIRPTAQKLLSDSWFKQNKSKKQVFICRNALENMKQFRVKDKLQKATLMFIINAVSTQEEKMKLMKTFQSIDTNNDGQLSREELIQGYKNILGEEEAIKEVNRIFQMVDENGSGSIDYTDSIEFVLATTDKKNMLSQENLKAVFAILDKDQSGQISKKELLGLFNGGKVPQKMIKNFIKNVDKNGDGEISFKEFQDIMQKVIQS